MTVDEIQVSSSSLGVVIVRSDGLDADPVARRLLGSQDAEVPPAELMEKIQAWVAEAPELPTTRTINATIDDGTETCLNLEARRAGEVAIVLIRRASIADRNEGAGAVAMALDSVHRQTTHEFLGLLNSISLNVTLLGRAARGDLANLANAQEKQQDWVKAVEEQLHRLTELIDKWSSVLFVSAEESSTVDLRSILGDLDFLLTPMAQRNQVEFEIRYPETEVSIDAPKRELLRLLASWTVVTLGALAKGDRWVLDLTESEQTAVLLASAGEDSEADEDGPKEDGPEDEASRENENPLADVFEASFEVFERLFDDMGGNLAVAPTGRWTLCWPMLPEAEKEV